MLAPGETFNASYPAVPESVTAARKALTDFTRQTGASEDQLHAVRLAASEAVTNAVIHAYTCGEPGEIQVTASYLEDELWLLICDTGSGMRARENSPGLGLGLALIAQMADEFQILTRGSGGTELRMRFSLSSDRRVAAQQPHGATDRRRQLSVR